MEDPASRLHPSEWDFRFRSGRLCLDFIATVGDREHLAFDRWRAPEDFSRWCVEARLLGRVPPVREDQFASARRLREALYRLVSAALAGMQPDPGDLQHLNAAARTPSLAPQLTAIGQKQTFMSDTPYEGVLATVARDAVDLLSDRARERVRKCADAHCSILFLDTSRPGRRRWCSMDGCGNKVKKAAYRKRQRS